MRQVLKDRYGPKTRLKLITPPRGLSAAGSASSAQRGFRPPTSPAAAASGLIDAAEERALWSRFGL